jgi:hypothetical protein
MSLSRKLIALIIVLYFFSLNISCVGGLSNQLLDNLTKNGTTDPISNPIINDKNISLQISIDKEFMTDYIGTSASPSYTNDKNLAAQTQVFTYMNAANNSIIIPSSEIINMDLGIVTVTGPFKGTNLLIKVPQKTQQTTVDSKDAEILMGTIPQTLQTTLKTVVPIDYKSNIATSIIKQDYNGYQDVIFDASLQMSNKIVEKTDAINVLGVSNTQIKDTNTQEKFIQLKFEIANAEDKMPVIDSMSPRSLQFNNTANTVFNIIGKNFGTVKDKIKIEIEDKSYSILECSDKLIKFPLPLELMLATNKFSIVLIKYDDNNNYIRKTIDNAFEITPVPIITNTIKISPPFNSPEELITALKHISSGSVPLSPDKYMNQLLDLFPPETTLAFYSLTINTKHPRLLYKDIFEKDKDNLIKIFKPLSESLESTRLSYISDVQRTYVNTDSYTYAEIPVYISEFSSNLHIKIIKISTIGNISWYLYSL